MPHTTSHCCCKCQVQEDLHFKSCNCHQLGCFGLNLTRQRNSIIGSMGQRILKVLAKLTMFGISLLCQLRCHWRPCRWAQNRKDSGDVQECFSLCKSRTDSTNVAIHSSQWAACCSGSDKRFELCHYLCDLLQPRSLCHKLLHWRIVIIRIVCWQLQRC